MNVIKSARMPRATETPVRIAIKEVMEADGLDEYSANPRIAPTVTNTLPSNDKMNAVNGRSSKAMPPVAEEAARTASHGTYSDNAERGRRGSNASRNL